MKKYLVYFIFFSLALSAQKNEADSLRALLNATTADSSKVQLLHQVYMLTDSVNYSFKGLELAKKINYKKGIALSLLDIGRHYYFDGKGDLALSYLIQATKIAEEIKEKKILVSAFRYIGFVYRPHDPFTAEDYYKKSLKIAEEINDELSASYALSAIGNIYEGIYEGPSDNNKKALDYYLKSLAIREKKGSSGEIASSLNETSRMYDLLGEYEKGLKLRLRGLEIAERSGSTENIIYLCNVLGNVYSLRLHDYKKGLEYQLRAFTIAETQKNNFEVRYDIAKGIAYSYYSLGDFKRSNDYYRQCVILNDSIKGRRNAYDYNLAGIKHGLEKELEKQKQLLMEAEIQKGKAEAARQTILRNAFLLGFTLVLVLAIIMFRGYRQKQRSNRELDLKNKKIEIAYKTLAVSEKNFKQITETITDVFYLYNILEKKYEYVSPNCESVLGLSTAYFYEGKSSKAIVFKDDLQLVIDANEKIDSGTPYDIEYRVIVNGQVKWIAEKSSPIFENGILVRNSGICRDITQRKNDEELLYKKNKDITNSILYARTIQNAILVPKDEIAKNIKEFFILSKPKDIVSGDFYFYKETPNGIFLAAADCTGHGVPAGFMSMIGNAFLNEIINSYVSINPAQVLDKLRNMIIKSLNQNKSDAETKDGMDIALLYFEKGNNFVQYAGAFNSLYLVRNNELIEYNADIFPIGIHVVEELTPFTNTRIELQKNDALYIFSDGYADQIGGPKGKRLTKKQMKALLVSVQDKKMYEQEIILNKQIDEWKGNYEQLDDIIVIGIKV